VFSALEIVPLSLIGFGGVPQLRVTKGRREGLRLSVAALVLRRVAFWNLVGAGVFGFLINPPIVLYYAQGLNTTPIHSHAALFGVYGSSRSRSCFSACERRTAGAWSDGL